MAEYSIFLNSVLQRMNFDGVLAPWTAREVCCLAEANFLCMLWQGKRGKVPLSCQIKKTY